NTLGQVDGDDGVELGTSGLGWGWSGGECWDHIFVVPAYDPDCACLCELCEAIRAFERLCYVGGQLTADLAESIVDVARHDTHTKGRRESDQSGQQRVFNQILTGLIPVQTAQNLSKSFYHLDPPQHLRILPPRGSWQVPPVKAVNAVVDMQSGYQTVILLSFSQSGCLYGSEVRVEKVREKSEIPGGSS